MDRTAAAHRPAVGGPFPDTANPEGSLMTPTLATAARASSRAAVPTLAAPAHVICGGPPPNRLRPPHRCSRCRQAARRIELLVASGHPVADAGRRSGLSPHAASAALELQQQLVDTPFVALEAGDQLDEPGDDTVRSIIAAWGPLPGDLSDREVMMLRRLTHVPSHLVRELVDAEITRSRNALHWGFPDADGPQPGVLSYTGIAKQAGIDERLLKRLLGIIPECGKRVEGRLYGARHRRAISLFRAEQIVRAIGYDPTDVPGL